MSTSHSDCSALCPLHVKNDGRNQIVCKGRDDGGSIPIWFHWKADLGIQKSFFCCQYYRNCEI